MIVSVDAEHDAERAYLAAGEIRVAEMRRIAFAIEDALEKTPRGVSIERPIALFIKHALFDYADRAELDF